MLQIYADNMVILANYENKSNNIYKVYKLNNTYIDVFTQHKV